MNIALRGAMTVSDYLAWADAQSDGPRTELIDGQIVAMSPERLGHHRIKIAVLDALRKALVTAGIKGEVFTDRVAVPIDEYTAYEPDVLVYCGDPLPDKDMKVADPLIVVEVLSPSSAHTDTSAKLIGYFKLASVRHYLIIDPDACTVTHHARAADGRISAQTLAAGTLRLDPPGLTLDVATLFG